MNNNFLNLENQNLQNKNNFLEKIQNLNLITKVKNFINFQLNLKNNNFNEFPKEILILNNLEFLDISNNPLKNINEIIQNLKKLKNLKELKIDLTNKNDVFNILNNLPNLKFLNGKKTKEENFYIKEIDINENEIKEVNLNNEIEYFNKIFEKIQNFENSAENKKKFKNDFQKKLKDQIKFINENMNVSNLMYVTNIIKIKFEIYNFLFNKLKEFFENNILFQIVNEIQSREFFIQKDLINLIQKFTLSIKEQNNLLKNEFIKLNNDFLNTKENLKNKDKMNKILYENNLKLQNKIKNSNSNSSNNLYSSFNNNNNNIQFITETLKRNNSEKFSKTQKFNKKNYLNHSYSTSFHTTLQNKKKYPVIIYNLSKNQLLSLINDIYKNKLLFDKKCKENKLPRETMEEYLYNYLNNKYGLKNITINWVASIINSIKKYVNENNEIKLFLKILRNEIEEESFLIFIKLKSTLNDLLMFLYQNKFPYKNDFNIKKIVNNIEKNFIVENDWKYVIKCLFVNDYLDVYNKVFNFVNEKNNVDEKYFNENIKNYVDYNNNNYSREKIKQIINKKNTNSLLYLDLIDLLLDVQINLRDKYLKNFLCGFKEVDNDNDGILNENEFRKLIKNFNVINNEEFESCVEKLLDKIDPNNLNIITFSDIINVLAEVVVDDNKTSILDKISEIEN